MTVLLTALLIRGRCERDGKRRLKKVKESEMIKGIEDGCEIEQVCVSFVFY